MAENRTSHTVVPDIQDLRCFPNDNSKSIDYVIAYSYSKDDVDKKDFKFKEDVRRKFLDLLKEETVDVYKIRNLESNNEYKVFILLHCSIDRLLLEAERVRLEMKISNVIFTFINTNKFSSIISYDFD
jgi:hypothetical protein